jgi:hypothetical protein
VPFLSPPVAPWQFVEQQSVATAQASPSVPQVMLVEPAGSAAHFEPLQMPEQHCESSRQLSSIWRQTTDEQDPELEQLTEQHCASELHGSPGSSQKSACVHAPSPPHVPEQHCASLVQATDPARQPFSMGVVHFEVVPSQTVPSQHSDDPPQVSPSGRH